MPNIEDVEVYYDLVVAFVSVVEGAMPLVENNSHLGMRLSSGGYVSTEYKRDNPSIEVFLTHDDSDLDLELVCDISSGDSNVEKLEEFAFFFKVHSLLRLFDEGVSSSKHVLKLLKS